MNCKESPKLRAASIFTLPRCLMLLGALAATAGVSRAVEMRTYPRVGRQADGSFIVSTEQRVESGTFAFSARPTDMALHPSGKFVAVLNQSTVLLVGPHGIIPTSINRLGGSAGFRGIVWSPAGDRLFVSISSGRVQEFAFHDGLLTIGPRIGVWPQGCSLNPRPGGMTITRNGQRLFVALTDRNSVLEVDLKDRRIVREYPVQNLPFEVKLSSDERTLIVSNWGGRIPIAGADDNDVASSGNAFVVVDPRGATSSGTVSLIERATGAATTVNAGLHPTAIEVAGRFAYVTNSGSDSLTEIDVEHKKATRTIPIRWGHMNLLGSMPCALAIFNKTAYVCNGGDNALCVIDLDSGRVRGFVPAGFYPISIALDKASKKAYVLNTKGNGSVKRTMRGVPGNVHDFQGTVSLLDLTVDLHLTTTAVANNNGWHRSRAALNPDLAVYQGAIKHVIYIIKENRSYDEILGDMSEGNGSRRLCFLGDYVTPNHHALARQFTLFDNAYVNGTNSADGHEWCTQAIANDYLEHFYTGYRTYPFDGSCAMAISTAGCLWDAVLKKGRTLRDYGEFCDARLATFSPKVRTWKDLWNDRISGRHSIAIRAGTHIRALKNHIHLGVLCWPLLQSDQERADQFIADYMTRSKKHTLPSLMILSLPCDHTEGSNPGYPKPQSMVADNDLALGRIVEAVSKSSQWKETCIFVIEDDTQFGVDHVDGHRTPYYAISPYTKRHFVDHELCNTVSMIRSIELMLGIGPMNRFDALTPPLTECFTDAPDLSTYASVPNRVALDVMNPGTTALQGQQLYWTKQSMALDWSGPDRADYRVLNRVIWHSVCGTNTPYPEP